MTIDDIQELHFIALIQSVPSILKHGIASRSQIKHLRLPEIANPLVQEKRKAVVIPGGYSLHDYANLYFHARNPMMCAIQDCR